MADKLMYIANDYTQINPLGKSPQSCSAFEKENVILKLWGLV